MPILRDIHGEVFNHEEPCPDLFCCKCDCTTCKRAWWAAGRPRPQDCPVHGSHTFAGGELPLNEAAPPLAPRRMTRTDFLLEASSSDAEADDLGREL
jgi:hypothetical protein